MLRAASLPPPHSVVSVLFTSIAPVSSILTYSSEKREIMRGNGELGQKSKSCFPRCSESLEMVVVVVFDWWKP